MLKSIKQFIETLNEKNILYCHWKSNEHLSESLNGKTDLDMLFHYPQRSQLEEVLSICGLKRFRACFLMQYNTIEDYVGFDKDSASIWHVHIHYKLTLGEKYIKGYTLPWDGYLLSRRISDKASGIYCSNPNDEYLLLLIRMSLKLRWRDIPGRLSSGDVRELNWLKERCSNDGVAESADTLLKNSAKHIKRLLNQRIEYKNQLFSLQRALRRELSHFTSLNLFSSYIKRTGLELLRYINGFKRKHIKYDKPFRRLSPSGGLIVAILGSDGSGKSTTVSYLRKEFGKKIDCVTVYLGGDSSLHKIYRAYKKTIRIKRNKPENANGETIAPVDRVGNPSNKLGINNAGKIIYSIAIALRKRKKLRLAYKARNNGLLVITDRYPQVDFLGGVSDSPLLSSYLKNKKGILKAIAAWEYGIYRKAYINPPDLVIKLQVPSELALERDSEITIDLLERKINAVKAIRLSDNTFEVDTSQDKINSFGEVMEIIWKHI